MTHVALVLSDPADDTAVLEILGRMSRRGPIRVSLWPCGPPSPGGHLSLTPELSTMGAVLPSHHPVAVDDLAATRPDLVLAANRGRHPVSVWRSLIRDLSRGLPVPVWIMNGHTSPPSSVTALIAPDGGDRITPDLSTEVLRLSFVLSRVLDVPLDILNFWSFPEEGLLRSWRFRTPDPEIAERKRRAAWVAQSDLARILATIPPDLSWRRLDWLQGPIVSGLDGLASNDALIVAGSAGRDGWAARFRPNLAEDLSRHWPTQVVIVKKPDPEAPAFLDGLMRPKNGPWPTPSDDPRKRTAIRH
ncbi:hypothetical protein [uncultured Paracoccus sp.]|uniref:hypothetical protein n=1 Tax=uncultured Paracoccus sp. TaxID=189685 RepID=UPI0025E896D5|nr:hypothetical protein [uncultured Paracoccus sp.]